MCFQGMIFRLWDSSGSPWTCCESKQSGVTLLQCTMWNEQWYWNNFFCNCQSTI